jgi:hypothetical protein
VSLVCHVTGCDFSAALAWLRTRGHLQEQQPRAQRPEQQQPRVLRRVIATYDYPDEHGEVLYHVNRLDQKGAFPTWREIDGERVNGVSAGTYERLNGVWYKVKNKPRPGAQTREFPSIRAVPTGSRSCLGRCLIPRC